MIVAMVRVYILIAVIDYTLAYYFILFCICCIILLRYAVRRSCQEYYLPLWWFALMMGWH